MVPIELIVNSCYILGAMINVQSMVEVTEDSWDFK